MDYAVRVFEFRTNDPFLAAVVSADSEEAAAEKADLPHGYLDTVRAWEVDEKEAAELIAEGADDMRAMA